MEFEDIDTMDALDSQCLECNDQFDEEFDSNMVQEKLEYLNNVDYSLNSPLILDEVINLTRFFKGQSHETRWSKTRWKFIQAQLDKIHFYPALLRDQAFFQGSFLKLIKSMDINCLKINNIMTATLRDCNDTYEVVKSFFESWLGKGPNNKKTRLPPKEIQEYGALFCELHQLTLLMNASGKEELESLSRSVKGLVLISKEGQYFADVYFKNLGRFYLTNGMCESDSMKMLLSRNMILMMKELCSARYHTLLSMIDRADDHFLVNDWRKLLRLYQTGDAILMDVGNQGYDLIKSIEPICNYKLTKMAHKYRSMVPTFPSFGEHVEQTVRDHSMVSSRFQRFYEMIVEETNFHLVLTYFGSFRHWGHPTVEYFEGLRKLEEQVNMGKIIDKNYANQLASDLAFMVLESKFKETKKWYVDASKVDTGNHMKTHIESGTWPTPKQITDFGDNWHLLPLIKCFDIPDVIDVSTIYADKSHSIEREEVVNHIKSRKKTPIPSKKVLETFINTPETNWTEFLEEINDRGLDPKWLVIGLKAKERELKRIGRFFTLMSWKLREYFVIIEYLIKCHYVPLFKGLTMADDLTTLTTKIMTNTAGQGLTDYSRICIANHIDYEKWNNHQRRESNEPVFTVMGKFLGYPRLIARTHEFFEQSLVYYNDRPDLMDVVGENVVNNSDKKVCWNGQKGGLEGLRQKGWSILNLLVIRREGMHKNASIQTLAQGDNQVICTNYRVQEYRDDNELKTSLGRIAQNNADIMASIHKGVHKLGLIINEDETMQSADYLCYGKVPVFRGVICGLETKRWSRIACVTNDQLPTLANVISTVGSNALTVAHSSESPINSIIHYRGLIA